MKTRKIAVIVGSLRRDSVNRKMAQVMIGMAPVSYTMDIIDIAMLPLYNQDLEEDGKIPPAWTEFREKMKNYEAFLFVTPEYNRSVPGVLKNALDVGSRPFGKSVWNGKPGAVASVSRGAIGGFGANHHLRQSLVYLNVPVMAQPEAYIGGGDQLFGPDGSLLSRSTEEFVLSFMKAFEAWIEMNLSGPDDVIGLHQ